MHFLLFYFYFFVFAGATFLLWLFFMLCLLNLDLVLLLKLFLPISLGFCFLLLIFCNIVLFANIRVKSVLYLLVSSRLRFKTWYFFIFSFFSYGLCSLLSCCFGLFFTFTSIFDIQLFFLEYVLLLIFIGLLFAFFKGSSFFFLLLSYLFCIALVFLSYFFLFVAFNYWFLLGLLFSLYWFIFFIISLSFSNL